MTKTQKTLLVTAAVAGLVVGAVVKAKTVSNDQCQNLAGKSVASETTCRNACIGCPAKTNSVVKN